MARFVIESKIDIFTKDGRFPPGTTVIMNLPVHATPSTFLTNPNFKNQIMSQFRNQGIDVAPNQLGYGYWKVTDTQR